MVLQNDFFGIENIDEDSSKIITNQHAIWKNGELKSIKEYYMLFNSISDYLPYMKSATNLYLFYCIASKNKTGESWYSIDSLANKLHVSLRTINTWNDRLRKLNLIERQQGVKKSAHTFLLPTRDYVDSEYNEPFLKGKIDMNELLNKVKKIYDALNFKKCNIFHLFQWRKRKGTDKFDVPYNSLVISISRECYIDEKRSISQAEKEAFKAATTRRIFIYVELPQDDPKFIRIMETPEDFSTEGAQFKKFNSPFKVDDFSQTLENTQEVMGVAVSTKYNLANYSSKDSCSKNYIEILTELDCYLDSIKPKLKEVDIVNDTNK